jgi:hypothetical protein
MASSPPQTKAEMKKWFEEGRFPSSLSKELLWASILFKLDQFGSAMDEKRSAVAKEQQKLETASQETQNALRMIQELNEKVTGLRVVENFHATALETLQAELKEWEELNITSMKVLAQSAVEMEKELVSQLQDQLLTDRNDLLALNEDGDGPKLSFLLNCFGAGEETIRELKDLSSMEFVMISVKELEERMVNLPRDQHIVVLYAQERLNHGRVPFDEHDCALCNCESAEDMSAFLQEHGLQVSPDLIRQTGALGRGALLFLTAQDLHLESPAQKSLLFKARADHRRIPSREDQRKQ